MDRRELLSVLRDAGPAAADALQDPQIAWVAEFVRLYEERGLIVGARAPALWKCCPNAETCWAKALDERPNDGLDDGNITLPWIGPAYREGGVLVLGMNFNDASGLATAFELAAGDAEAFTEGRRRVTYDYPGYSGTDYPYRSTRTAALLLQHLDGAAIVDDERPEGLVTVLRSIVRLQTIKCSPRNDEASKPTEAMWFACPPFLLEDEIAIAAPRYIAAFGGDVQWATRRLPAYTPIDEQEHLAVGTVEVAGRRRYVFGVPHPRATTWSRGQDALRVFLDAAATLPD